MFFVYKLQSITFPDQFYIGITENLKDRVRAHNSGGSIYTSKYMPWELIVHKGFKDKTEARKFEQLLRSVSEREFENQSKK